MSPFIVAAAWLAVGFPVAVAIGRVARYGDAEPYDTRRHDMHVKARPIGRLELQRIAGMFDPAALVLEEPLLGYTEVVFWDADAAITFVGLVRDGDYDAVRIAESVETVLRVPDGGPVTLGVALLPAWRPEEVAA